MLLLDTCSLIWYVSSPDLLSLPAKHAIEKHVDSIFISGVSAFELSKLAKKKKISLPMAARPWFYGVMEHYQIQEIPLTSDLVFLSEELVDIHHDPIDRFLIATALSFDLFLVTPDKIIAKYSGVKTIW